MINPFSTKFWTPGALPFQFLEPGETLNTLLEKSHRHPVCQIVGPHGSGKSTLLSELLKKYKTSGKNVCSLFFNGQHRRIPGDITFNEDQFFFVDGIEWLPFWEQFRLFSRIERAILVIHRPIWFVPILYRTHPQFSIFFQIVRQLAPDSPEESILRAVYERSGGNFRSAFFELYDQWELQSGAGTASCRPQ